MPELERMVQDTGDLIRRKARKSALINGAIFAAGLVVTFGTLSAAAKSGSSYFVFWGAIVFGLYGSIRALIRYSRADSEAGALIYAHVRRESHSPRSQ
ncbi:hypothetical protein FBY31_3875 [Arthrobacter sp. SLBN-100]|nr:hypothetical protein FBY31_3875 [Arthrobacter sp. SLBN-100]